MKKETDEFLQLSPPLQAVIKIVPYHDHDLNVELPPRICKMPKEVCEMYYEYFKRGIKGIQAKRLHESNLQKCNIQAPDGTKLNPRMSAVYSIYRKWKKMTENIEINKVSSVPICGSGAVPVTRSKAKHDSALISQVVKTEPIDEEDEFNCPNNVSSDVPQNEVNVKIEDTSEDDDYSCPTIESSSLNSQGKQLNVKIEDTDDEDDYNSHTQKRALKSNINPQFRKIRNKDKGPKIVNCCSLKTTHKMLRPKNNVITPTQVVTNSNTYCIPNTSIPTNNFVSMYNPPVPLITTNVNTFVVGSVQRAVSINNSYLTLFNPSSNTYTVVQLCLPISPVGSASNLYSAHFPNGIQSPTRV